MIHCRVQALLETNLGVDPETVDGQPISQPISHSISQSISQPISARVPSHGVYNRPIFLVTLFC